MKTVRLALLGFGNVGRAFVRLLLAKQTELQAQHGLAFRVTGIYTAHHGAAVDENGLPLERALDCQDLSTLTALPPPRSAAEFIAAVPAEALLENTPVNYADGEPAVTHLRLALERGMHAITANKGPVVHAYRSLSDLAQRQGRCFRFESTVMDGAPIFSLFREALPAANLHAFRGVLNSTTNLILTRMEQGESFAEAVAYCQRIGIAETDPSGDIDGWDAAVKVSALVTVLMGLALKPAEVQRQGIRHLTPEMVRQAAQNGQRWKLVCSAQRQGEQVLARVAPELVDASSPLYTVDGTTSLVQFETDVLGQLTIIEADPGPHTTAYGLLADLLNAIKGG